MSTPEQNLADVREFFERTIPDQMHLTAIDPKQRIGPIGRDFGTDVNAAVSWAAQQNTACMNVYYTVNRVCGGVNTKPSKADISEIRFAHVDVDPPKGSRAFTEDEKSAVETRLVKARPCTIIWSGNGAQALWRLGNGVTIDEVEQVNRGLIEGLGGDKGTHNADRLFRVPGLINWPDKKKSSIGRVPALASIRSTDEGLIDDLQHLLADFPVTAQRPNWKSQSVLHGMHLGDQLQLTADDLCLPDDALLRRLIDEPKGEDRSADAFAFACEALRGGLTPQQVVGVLLNDENAVSAHCLDQKDPQRAARRAIASAMTEPDVMTLFRAHDRERDRLIASGEAEVAEVARTAHCKMWTLETMLGEVVYIEEGSLVADTTRLGYVLSLSDFRNSSAASVMTKELPGKNGSVRKVKALVANEWLAHPDRTTVSTRTFKAGDGPIVVAPDGRTALNSWRGFRIGAAPNDWAKRAAPFVEHVGLLFGDDTARFLDWTAHIAQKPGELPSTAWLHISRKTGTGRNLIAKILGKVFLGYAALAFPLGATLRDGFNAALAGKVLAIVDEIDEGHSHRKHHMAQDLKQLVTEEVRTINQKFASKYEEMNACRWLIFSNSPAALPLEDEDRRFNVVQYGGEPKEASYYCRLYAMADDPSFIASVMQYLLQRDISGFNKGGRAELTSAKADLLDRTRSEDDQTLRDIVQRWPVDVITNSELHAHLVGGLTGAALRHALDRAGITRVGLWQERAPDGWGRQKVTAYAVRNHAAWKTAVTAALRKEVDRATKEEKVAALYDDGADLV